MSGFNVVKESDGSFPELKNATKWACGSDDIFAERRHRYLRLRFEDHKDVSFLIRQDGSGTAAALVYATRTPAGRLGWYEGAIPITLAEGLSDKVAEKVAVEAVRYLSSEARVSNQDRIDIHDESSTGELTPIGRACFKHRARLMTTVRAVVDLHLGDDALRRDVRKSFKSLISWGRKNLELRALNKDNPDRAAFHELIEFHKNVSGRSTRPQATWDFQFDEVTSGLGEVILGYLDGELVSGNIILDYGDTSLYSSGIYRRELFDLPLAHSLLFESMLSAGRRGITYFDLGEIPGERDVDPKEYNIGFFKRGFTSRLIVNISWHVPLTED